MRKILLMTLLSLICVPAFAGFYDSTLLSGKTKAFADQQIEPFSRLIAQSLNGGLGDPMNVGTLKVGAELVMTPFDKTGFLASAPVGFLPVPYAYGGLSLFDFVAFARISALPVSSGGKTPMILGGGLGMKIDFSPLITVTPALTYHRIENLDLMELYSLGGQLQLRINLLVLTPFANVGVSYTKINTDFVLQDGSKYNYGKTLFHASLGAKLFFLVGEVSILPERSYTLGASFGF